MRKDIKSFTLVDTSYGVKQTGYTNWPLMAMFFFACLVLISIVFNN